MEELVRYTVYGNEYFVSYWKKDASCRRCKKSMATKRKIQFGYGGGR